MKQRYGSIKKLPSRFLQSANSSGHFSFYYVYPINYCQSEIIWNGDRENGTKRKMLDRERKRRRPKNHSNKLFITCATLIIFSLPLIGFFIARPSVGIISFPRAFSPIDDSPIRCHVQSTIHHSNATILRM